MMFFFFIRHQTMKCSKVLPNIVHLKFPKLDTLQVYENKTQCYTARSMSFKNYLDYSKVPKVKEEDIELQFVRGSGPGGQSTNKTNNAVLIKHKPSGIVVKCHETRSVWENKKKAMENLVTKLDNLMNGEDSIEAQTKAMLDKKTADKNRKRKKLDELKAAFKEREGLK